MNIGDKVRFLNEIGGGRVAGFRGKDIVLVEDEDGFEIPMLVSEVVVVETDDYNIAKVNTSDTKDVKAGAKKVTETSGATRRVFSDEDYDPSERPITFKAKPVERSGGNLMNVYLAFVESDDQKGVESNDMRFDAYIVNDCNYRLCLQYLCAEGANWQMRYEAFVEPNTKQFVEAFKRSELPSMEHLCIQFVASKQDKPFALKPAMSVQLRLDPVKFYKMNTFRESPFFRVPAFVMDVVRDDRPARGVFVSADELKEALLPKAAESAREKREVSAPARREKGDTLEVDLHADALLDDLTGLSSSDILKRQMEEFHRVMDENCKRSGRKIVFIHGKGDGVLRKNILQDLKYRYKMCTWQDASFQEYGYGATLVKVK